MIQGKKIKKFIRCFILKSHSIFLQNREKKRRGRTWRRWKLEIESYGGE